MNRFSENGHTEALIEEEKCGANWKKQNDTFSIADVLTDTQRPGRRGERMKNTNNTYWRFYNNRCTNRRTEAPVEEEI